MAKTLIEVDTYAPTVTVPEGTDSRANAAEVVEGLAQALANRTHRLKTLVEAASVLIADQTFTGINTFAQATHHAAAPIVEPAITATKWNLVARWKADNGPVDGPADAQYVSVYTGIDPAGGIGQYGGLAIVYNAQWRASPTGGYPNGHWDQLDYGQSSIALIFRDVDARLCVKAAGEQDWLEWPAVLNLNTLGGSFLSEALYCERAYAAANFDGSTANGYRYQGARNRTSPIPLSAIYGPKYVRSDAAIGIQATSIGGDLSGGLWIPVRVPPYCSFGEIRIRHVQLSDGAPSVTNPDRFQLMKRSGLGDWAPVGAAKLASTTAGETTTPVHTGSTETPTDVDEYAVRWITGRWATGTADAASAGNHIIAVELDWSDIGPSNGITG